MICTSMQNNPLMDQFGGKKGLTMCPSDFEKHRLDYEMVLGGGCGQGC